MKNKQYIKVIALLVGLIGLSVLLFLVFGLIEGFLDKAENNLLEDDAYSFSDTTAGQLFYQSEWYVLNDSVESYLILGIDKIADPSEDRLNSEQSDFLALLILDKKKEKFHILHLNRDTMADIPRMDISGKEYGTLNAQLALAHTYGDTERERCRNTVKTVENLLYGIDVQHYLSVTMDAVSALNDRVGGVTLSLMDDFTHLDESFQKDTVVTLTGAQALSYVRARSSMEDSTNLRRMERQQQYVSALCEKFQTLEKGDLIEAATDVSEYISSDCTVDQLSRLAERLETYTYEGILSLPGEAIKGDQYIEYYLDEAAAQETIVELFYEPRK